MLDPNGQAAQALRSLPLSQVSFIKALPKAELHAHLNGCIPLPTLQSLASQLNRPQVESDSVRDVLENLARGVNLDKIDNFFDLFPAIYEITSSPGPLRNATAAVLDSFLQLDADGFAQCSYLELRTTPRSTPAMTRKQYLQAVLDEVRPRRDQAALIVSIDRRMSVEVATECVRLATELKAEGEPVVGIDLCGDPLKGDMPLFNDIVPQIHSAGLGLTLHIAETLDNTDTNYLLSWKPDRLGHATFLGPSDMSIVAERRTPLEICISSNLQCKTVPMLADHHLHSWLQQKHPMAICTDDTLPFRTTLLGEYALLLAVPPLGLGLSEEVVAQLAQQSLEARFPPVRERLAK